MARRCSREREFQLKHFSITSKVGEPLHEFLEDFPTVTQDQVIMFLEELKSEILPSAKVVRESC